jgi:hypothetical protein
MQISKSKPKKISILCTFKLIADQGGGGGCCCISLKMIYSSKIGGLYYFYVLLAIWGTVYSMKKFNFINLI